MWEGPLCFPRRRLGYVGGALWFPGGGGGGGGREMRLCGSHCEDGCSTHVHVTLCPFQETLPLYKRLEKRLELMNEYVQVTAEMNQAATSLNLSGGQDVLYTDLYNTLVHIREDFDSKHRH